MAYWIFKCNPERYDLAKRLEHDEKRITWTVSRHRDEIGPGDTAFLWQTGPERGICAVMRIDEAPRVMPELPSEQRYWVTPDTAEELRVIGTLTRRDIDLSHSELRKTPGLENLSVFRAFQQGTNFPVTPEEGAIIMRLIHRD